ncbi:hypothetical protein AV530_019555 [Patagioenas fasciata monilis]|uniref:Uncharacterized protein n=1 Tax=Patagioenas fasciata monilis TaxID=372326 RepID=A0A1V4JEF2_PATFA|nr:hypothetical protein AV530_019555 [Patagioenas fasciata monilis]
MLLVWKVWSKERAEGEHLMSTTLKRQEQLSRNKRWKNIFLKLLLQPLRHLQYPRMTFLAHDSYSSSGFPDGSSELSSELHVSFDTISNQISVPTQEPFRRQNDVLNFLSKFYLRVPHYYCV